MIEDVEKAIREYIEGLVHMSLSTVADNRPWTCELHFAYSDDLRLYFYTKKSARHSIEIANNPHVSGSIVRQHAKEDRPQGVYFEGIAQKVDDITEDSDVFRVYNTRFGLSWESVDLGDAPNAHAFYEVVVSDWCMFDGLQSKPSRKYHIDWKRTLVTKRAKIGSARLLKISPRHSKELFRIGSTSL